MFENLLDHFVNMSSIVEYIPVVDADKIICYNFSKKGKRVKKLAPVWGGGQFSPKTFA